jgi:hypothetical protein
MADLTPSRALADAEQIVADAFAAEANKTTLRQPPLTCWWCRCERSGVICRCLAARVTGNRCAGCQQYPRR